MKRRVLLDTNVVLDVLLARKPWLADAQAIWRAVDEGRLKAFLPASALTDIFYLARRLADLTRARQAVQTCLGSFEIAPVDRQTLEHAYGLGGPDFEDDVLIACAAICGLDAIVTRDASGFMGSSVPVWTPAVCRAQLTRD